MRQRLRRLRNTAETAIWLLMARCAPVAESDPPQDWSDKDILIIQWNAIGDALMTTPLLSSLKRRFPTARIDVLANTVNRAVFDCQSGTDAVHCFRTRSPGHNWRLWRKLRQRKYDIIMDVSAGLRSACTARSLNAASTIGFARRLEAGWFRIDLSTFFRSTRSYSDERHIPSLIGSLADPWLGACRIRRMSLPVPADATRRAWKWFEEQRVEPDRAVILHPGGKWTPKRWPEPYWIELCHLLLPRWTPVLVGSHQDEPAIRCISAAAGPGVQTLVGSDIPTLAAIVQRSRVAICNDSFIMHLASALGTPVVALFGPVRPSRVAPEEARVEILYERLFCSPCELYFTADKCWRGMNFCLERIEPTEVVRAMDRLLGIS